MIARPVASTSLASWRVEVLVPLTANRMAAAPKASFSTIGAATSVRYAAMTFSGPSQGIRSGARDDAHVVLESATRNAAEDVACKIFLTICFMVLVHHDRLVACMQI